MTKLNLLVMPMRLSSSQASSEPFRVVELQEDGMMIAIDLQSFVSDGSTTRLLLDMSQ